MIRNVNDFVCWIKKENIAFLATVEQSGGWALRLRQITAQILWFLFWYSLSVWVLPVKDFLLVNVTALVLLGSLGLVWSILQSHLPSWTGAVLKGDFFFQCRGIFLNLWIFGLILFNVFMIFIPVGLYKKVINYQNE